jgi:hypothetical protein
MSYCGNCGSQLSGGQKFCAGCGAPVTVDTSATGSAPASNQPNLPTQPSQASTNAEPQDSSEAALQNLATLNAQSPPLAKSSDKKILIAMLVILFLGGIAAVGGMVYLGYRAKQRASAALNKLEGRTDDNPSGNSRKVTSDDAARNVAGHKADGTSSGNDDNKQDPLSSVLGKLQGGDSTSSARNMATNILEDLGVKNPGMPPDLVRNIPHSALATPLPCPTGKEIDPAKLAGGRIQIKPGTILTTSWSLPLADAESSHISNRLLPRLSSSNSVALRLWDWT